PSQAMSHCADLCLPSWDSPCPQPLTNACSDLCVTSCGDSKAIIHPPPVVITFPGPVLSSCPQQSFVGSCSPLTPNRPPGGSLGFRGYGNPVGLRGSILFGGCGGAWNSGRSCSSGCSSVGRGSFGPF
ncbi:KRFJ protein, partial [Grantiella picta]|nr:KRFJ protein [Grantiella picta]